MGLAFKENCPDLRNTRVVDIIGELQDYHANIDVFDPWIDPEEAEHEYGLKVVTEPKTGHYDAIILCVGHNEFRAMGVDAIRQLGRDNHVLFDVKHILPKDRVDGRL